VRTRGPTRANSLLTACSHDTGMQMRALAIAYGRGFTLIEVLAALVIVSLGMMAVIQAVSQTASNSSYLRDKTLAHWVALNRLTEARLEQSAPKVDETSDEVEMAGRTWRWTMTVTQTPVETMRRIDVSVRPAEADEDSSMATLTGFYGSAIAPPGAAIILWEGLGDANGPNAPGDDEEEEEDEDNPPTDEQEPQPDPDPDPDLEQDPGDLEPTDESL
jgi:general secretion pathway protein I